MNKTYITTAIPYVNGRPHVGHALDYCLADVCARYHRLCGEEVKFQAGTDEHGGKIFKKAEELGKKVDDYVTENAEVFKDFIKKLNISYTDFIRTTDERHIHSCQEIWKRLEDHIYKAKYDGWYCTGCERYIVDTEYEENHGICPDHQKLYERLEEENYYLRISDFKKAIVEAIDKGEMKILPEFRKKEILKLIEDSPDVSISRPKTQLTWGVPVPDDDSQVMYVWIDALSNYISVLDYPEKDILEWWPATAQFVGKDVLRFHTIIWPAMLIGLGLPLPKTISSHGMILVDGQKMSKSIGNVVDPIEVIEKHGTDAFRYYFLRHVDSFSDSDFTWEKFEDAYNNELANDLGNLVQRVATLVSKNEITIDGEIEDGISDEFKTLIEEYDYSGAFDWVWEKVQGLNKKIDNEKPWELAKKGENDKLKECLNNLVLDLLRINVLLSLFIPETSEKIVKIFTNPVKPPEQPLFPKQ